MVLPEINQRAIGGRCAAAFSAGIGFGPKLQVAHDAARTGGRAAKGEVLPAGEVHCGAAAAKVNLSDAGGKGGVAAHQQVFGAGGLHHHIGDRARLLHFPNPVHAVVTTSGGEAAGGVAGAIAGHLAVITPEQEAVVGAEAVAVGRVAGGDAPQTDGHLEAAVDALGLLLRQVRSTVAADAGDVIRIAAVRRRIPHRRPSRVQIIPGGCVGIVHVRDAILDSKVTLDLLQIGVTDSGGITDHFRNVADVLVASRPLVNITDFQCGVGRYIQGCSGGCPAVQLPIAPQLPLVCTGGAIPSGRQEGGCRNRAKCGWIVDTTTVGVCPDAWVVGIAVAIVVVITSTEDTPL